MKKLTVLLAAVMAFAFSATAYAATPSDLAEQPVKVQDAFAKTMALGIINGYEDGTVGPEQNITRAEFAKIAVTAAGAKDTAEMLANNSSSFKDVKAGQWYTGWVNASESLGIFQGDGNGNFRPNDTITNQEVITVLMRLLGYNDNLTGTWPVNYVTQANKIEILDDVAVVAAQAAKRADVVVMLDATLDSEIVTYDKDTDEFVQKQSGVGTSTAKTLLDDSFKGAFDKEASFQAIDQVRDAQKLTLNMSITPDVATTPNTLIIDDETRVSANGGSLFDLDGHQGKVYYVKDGDKYYARFIEVESYTKTVTDAPKAVAGKVAVNNTNYNAATTVAWSTNAPNTGAGSKNSNYILYFNDDDQVYAVKSDKDMVNGEVGNSYYVKSASASTVRLFGSKSTNKTITVTDDVLIYTDNGFVAPADLKVGDAIRYVAKDLYVMVDEVEGTLNKTNSSSKSEAPNTVTTTKYNVDGKSYVGQVAVTDGSGNAVTDSRNYVAKQLDDKFDDATVDMDDIYGNNVKFILNKDNTVSAMIVDDTITGTKLYGIVLGGDGGTGVGNNKTSSTMTIFTSEGKTVTYDLDLDTASKGYAAKDFAGDGKSVSGKYLYPGAFIEYKLDKDGEIKTINTAYDYELTAGASYASSAAIDSDTKIEIDDNRYVGTANAVLADNVVIFEVDFDDEDIDPTIVTRSSFLSEDSITPATIDCGNSCNTSHKLSASFAAFKNSNGEIKAMAYTEASGATHYYGVADGNEFKDSDTNRGIMFVGDENTYDVNGATITDKDLVVYTKSGDSVDVVKVYTDKSAIASTEVTGWSNGKISFVSQAVYTDDAYSSTANRTDAKTDSETVVYVMNSNGEFELGDLDSISKGAFVTVAKVDADGYAELVIVDEYPTL